jgi:hypothetical protein
VLKRGDWDYHNERERPGTGFVEEAGAIDTITDLRQASRHVVQRAFQLQPTQPLPLRKPVEHRKTCVELEIQLVRVCATICRPLGVAEFVDDVEVGSDPTARACCGKPNEVGLELQLRRALPIERKEDRFDSELQPRRSRRKTEREDDLEFSPRGSRVVVP